MPLLRAAARVSVTLALFAGLLAPMGGRAAAAGGVPAFDHIFTILMENHNYDQIIGNMTEAPYVNGLASKFGLATNYFAVAHPSLPNYLALTGGSTFGISSDCTGCFQNQPNIAVDRVEASGRTWKAYAEGLPSPGFVGDAYPYMQKHNDHSQLRVDHAGYVRRHPRLLDRHRGSVAVRQHPADHELPRLHATELVDPSHLG